jgi:enoyl-CoA hydratase/carnithine racemase
VKDNDRIDRTGGVARVKLDWVCLGADETRSLERICDSLRDDAAVRAVVIEMTGGWDIALEETGDPLGWLAEQPQPVIAAVSGRVSGGGLALALASDLRVAADDARFAVTELTAGRLPAGGVIARLTRLIGPGNAGWMLLGGEPIGAQDALRVGLVSEVVPAGQLPERAQAIAARIAERGPLAVRYAKEAVRRGLEMPLEQALRFETDLTVILQTTADRAEGVRAFMEKRAPEFKGE